MELYDQTPGTKCVIYFFADPKIGYDGVDHGHTESISWPHFPIEGIARRANIPIWLKDSSRRPPTWTANRKKGGLVIRGSCRHSIRDCPWLIRQIFFIF